MHHYRTGDRMSSVNCSVAGVECAHELTASGHRDENEQPVGRVWDWVPRRRSVHYRGGRVGDLRVSLREPLSVGMAHIT